MLKTVESLATVLSGTVLAGATIRQVAIATSSQHAFALEVPQRQALEAWQVLRTRLEETGRYPVITEDTEGALDRSYYEEETMCGLRDDTAPDAILARVPQADVDAFLAMEQTASAAHVATYGFMADGSRQRFGIGPSASHFRVLLTQGALASIVEVEQWLFDWELQYVPPDVALLPPALRYIEWFTPSSPHATVLLLPTPQSWEALAYLHWFGAGRMGTPVAIRFLQRWQERYAAELVGHYGTMLNLTVGRRPRTPAEAFSLAWEQNAFAHDTLGGPGVSLRDHARALLAVDHWFFHERP